MEEYLHKDVLALKQVVTAMGVELRDEFEVDIRVNFTAGSCAVKIWKGLIEQDIAKITDEVLYNRISDEACRGGLAGPLGLFDCAAPEGKKIYKYDVTSLYPASFFPLETTTSGHLYVCARDGVVLMDSQATGVYLAEARALLDSVLLD